MSYILGHNESKKLINRYSLLNTRSSQVKPKSIFSKFKTLNTQSHTSFDHESHRSHSGEIVMTSENSLGGLTPARNQDFNRHDDELHSSGREDPLFVVEQEHERKETDSPGRPGRIRRTKTVANNDFGLAKNFEHMLHDECKFLYGKSKLMIIDLNKFIQLSQNIVSLGVQPEISKEQLEQFRGK